jgi:hypothetical protein
MLKSLWILLKVYCHFNIFLEQEVFLRTPKGKQRITLNQAEFYRIFE